VGDQVRSLQLEIIRPVVDLNLKTSESIESAHQVALALKRTARVETDETARSEITALRLRIAHCNDLGNHYLKFDEDRTSTGRFWRCGSKLCADCLAAQSRRNRKKLRSALQQQQLIVGEQLSFVTLTMTNPKLPLVEARRLIDRAWSLLRKRKLFADLISGGAKSEEFTLTPNGYNYHLHLIIRHRFLLYQELRRVWTECVEQAFREAGRELIVNTKDKLLLVNVQRVNSREKSIAELCKYVTKSSSWTKIPTNDLRSIALMRRWMRMFELFGSFRDKTILDTARLSDGEADALPRRKGWRDRLQDIGLTLYSLQLAEEVRSARDFQRRALEKQSPGCKIYSFTELQ